MDIYEIMNNRFDATLFPMPTDEESKDAEKLTQYYLEHSFFRDFVYRNPDRTKGKEFCDALIIFDDTLIIVQNKACLSLRSPKAWSEKNINSALKQLCGSYRMIKNGIVKRFYNETLKFGIEIDLSKYTSIYGLVILSIKSEPYDPFPLIISSNEPDISYNIMSLEDLIHSSNKMDTAGDFIVYLELRADARKYGFIPLVNNEEKNMYSLVSFIPKVLNKKLENINEAARIKTLDKYEIKLINGLKNNEDYEFSLLFDDMIARAHDIDKDRYGSEESACLAAHKVAEVLGYVTRERRIELGKRMYSNANKAVSGSIEITVHLQRQIKTIYLYIYTGMPRVERTPFLQAIAIAAQSKYGYNRIFAVATEPIGSGRSYDYVFIDDNTISKAPEVIKAMIELLPDLGKEELI